MADRYIDLPIGVPVPLPVTGPLTDAELRASPVSVVEVADGVVKNIYSAVNSVAQSVLTTVCTYTVPGGKVAHLLRTEFAGTNIAHYSVVLNATVIASKYTNFGARLNEESVFDEGLPLVAGDILQIKVIHNRPYLGDFNARILVVEK